MVYSLVFGFGVLGVPLFSFSFFFFLGKGGDSSFFKFLELFESLFNIHPTDDPPSKRTSQEPMRGKKNSPKHRPPRPKKQTQTPHLHTRR